MYMILYVQASATTVRKSGEVLTKCDNQSASSGGSHNNNNSNNNSNNNNNSDNDSSKDVGQQVKPGRWRYWCCCRISRT